MTVLHWFHTVTNAGYSKITAQWADDLWRIAQSPPSPKPRKRSLHLRGFTLKIFWR